MFNHVEVPQLEELEVTEVDGRRMYKTPKGDLFPSVTTVLSANPEKKKGLEEWRERIGRENADRISTQAAIRGEIIHKMCEDFLNNKDPYIDQMPANVFTFNTVKNVLKKYINNIRYQEAPLYSYYLKVAGRVDCIAEFSNTLSIIDFKTSRKEKKREWIKDYFMQTSAYAVMYEEMTEVPVKQLVVIIAVDGSEPQIFVEDRDNHIGDFVRQRYNYEENINV